MYETDVNTRDFVGVRLFLNQFLLSVTQNFDYEYKIIIQIRSNVKCKEPLINLVII